MRTFLILTLILIVVAGSINADAPTAMNYQGLLTDAGGTPVADASYSVVFTIYDAASVGNSKWTETQSVTTIDGLFAVLLGSVNPILDTVFNGTTRYLGIAVAGGSELTPRTALVSVPYSFRTATIDGASGGNITSKVSIGSGHTNSGTDAFVAGFNDTASGAYSTIGGGYWNVASGSSSAIGGGNNNDASSDNSTISGGTQNEASSPEATVGGGKNNTSSGRYGIVSGGSDNVASGHSSAVGGGRQNHALGQYSTIAGGGGPIYSDSSVVSGDFSAIGGGQNHRIDGNYATIAGGRANRADGHLSTVAGGYSNISSDSGATISGGSENVASGKYSTVGGGLHDTASGEYSTVSGGVLNIASGYNSTVGGGSKDTASGAFATVGGGTLNVANANSSVIAGGYDNFVDGNFSTVGGGQSNTAGTSGTSYLHSTVGGGHYNRAEGDKSTISGGNGNLADGHYSFIGGGVGNRASGTSSVIAGGGGFLGDSNSASGMASVIPGGQRNVAAGDLSFAAGFRAQANHDGCFVWADSTDADFASTAEDQFLIRASGGVGINTDTASATLHLRSVPGSGQEILRLQMERTWAFRQYSATQNSSLELASLTSGNKDFLVTTDGDVGISSAPFNPSAKLHVIKGSAGSVTASSASIGVFESNSIGVISILTPAANYSGLLFGNPQDEADGAILYNHTESPRGLVFRANGNVTRLTIDSSGDVCSQGSIASCSDARYKTDVTTLSNSLSRVLQMRGVKYNWKQNEFPEKGFDNKTHLGFIAQEVEQLFPEIVLTDNEGYKSVDYGRLTPVLVEAIKDQQNQIDELKSKLVEIDELKKLVNLLVNKSNEQTDTQFGQK